MSWIHAVNIVVSVGSDYMRRDYNGENHHIKKFGGVG